MSAPNDDDAMRATLLSVLQRLDAMQAELHGIRELGKGLAVLTEQIRTQNDGIGRAFRAIDALGNAMRAELDAMRAAERERVDTRLDLVRLETRQQGERMSSFIEDAEPKMLRVTRWQGGLAALLLFASLAMTGVGSILVWNVDHLLGELQQTNARQDRQNEQQDARLEQLQRELLQGRRP